MKRIVTPSLIEHLNANLYVSTIRLKLRHDGQPAGSGSGALTASSSQQSMKQRRAK